MLLRSGRLARLVSPSGQSQPGHSRMAGGQGAGPVPAGYPGDWEWQEGYPPTYPFAPLNAPNAYSGASSTTSQAQPAPQTLQNNVGPTSSDPSSFSNSSDSPPHSITSPKRASDSKALLALAEEADELEGWGAIGAMSMTMEGVGRASDAGSAARRERERSSTTTAGTFSQSAGSNPLLSPSVSATPVTTTSNVAQINQSSTPSNTNTHTSTATSSLPVTLPSAGMYRNNYHPATASHSSLPANIPVGPGAMSPRSTDGFAGSPPSVAGDHLDSGRVGIGAGPNPADQNPPVSNALISSQPLNTPFPTTRPAPSFCTTMFPFAKLQESDTRSTRSTSGISQLSHLRLTLPTSSKNLLEGSLVDVGATNECRSGKRSTDPCALSSSRMWPVLRRRLKNSTAITW